MKTLAVGQAAIVSFDPAALTYVGTFVIDADARDSGRTEWRSGFLEVNAQSPAPELRA